MIGIMRAAAIFIGSWLVAQVVDAALRSAPGNALARRLGHPELGQPAGASLVANYARGVTGVLISALFAMQARPREEEQQPAQELTLADRLTWLSDALIAASSVARVAADVLHERREVEELHRLGG